MIEGHYRKQGKALSIEDGRTGSITVVQRFVLACPCGKRMRCLATVFDRKELQRLLTAKGLPHRIEPVTRREHHRRAASTSGLEPRATSGARRGAVRPRRGGRAARPPNGDRRAHELPLDGREGFPGTSADVHGAGADVRAATEGGPSCGLHAQVDVAASEALRRAVYLVARREALR